jgi:hypothetical protein
MKDKLMTMIVWGIEEILGTKAEVIKELATTKDT